MTKNQSPTGFTLLEVLMVIIVIGILATMTSASLISVRSKASDVKRLNDIREIQHALDSFAEDNGAYPTATQFIPGGSLIDPINSRVYLEKIPNNPVPKIGGGCPEEYTYVQRSDGRSYTLTYCLGNKISDLSSGKCTAMPGIICAQNLACDCEDVNKNCCGWCNTGEQCGGGTLFAKNFRVDDNHIFDLVVDNLSFSFYPVVRYDSAIPLTLAGANSQFDGAANTTSLITSPNHEAANVCGDLTQNGKSDWYLPASQEVMALCNYLKPPAQSIAWSRLSSTEVDAAYANYVWASADGQSCTTDGWGKDGYQNINCVRRAP